MMEHCSKQHANAPPPFCVINFLLIEYVSDEEKRVAIQYLNYLSLSSASSGVRFNQDNLAYGTDLDLLKSLLFDVSNLLLVVSGGCDKKNEDQRKLQDSLEKSSRSLTESAALLGNKEAESIVKNFYRVKDEKEVPKGNTISVVPSSITTTDSFSKGIDATSSGLKDQPTSPKNK